MVIRMRKSVVASLCVLMVVGYFIYSCLSLASELDCYISDEAWYVSSARNILEKIFSAMPRMDGVYATVFIHNSGVMNFSAVASSLGVSVLYRYEYLPAVYVEATSFDAVKTFCKAVNGSDVVYGWRFPDVANMTFFNYYFNFEHAPMAKYLIGLSMLLIGDRPLYWRIPSIIAGAITLILVFMLVRSLLRSHALALLTVFLTSIDPLFKSMSVIAMLDIWTALFTVLAAYFLAEKRYELSILAVAVGSTFKYTSLTFMATIILFYIVDAFYRGKGLKHMVIKVFKVIGFSSMLIVLVQVAANAPIIVAVGVDKWLYLNTIGLMKAHVANVGHPAASLPWEWFFGIKAFCMHNNPLLIARGFVSAYALAFILMLFELPSCLNVTPSRRALLMLAGTFMGFITIYILLRRDLFSFYAVQITPLIYTFLVLVLFEYSMYKEYAKTIKRWKMLWASGYEQQ